MGAWETVTEEAIGWMLFPGALREALARMSQAVGQAMTSELVPQLVLIPACLQRTTHCKLETCSFMHLYKGDRGR